MSQPPLPPRLPPAGSPTVLPPAGGVNLLQYATPLGVAAPAGSAAFRDGNQLITNLKVDLPQLCIKCNEPATWYKERKLYRAHPAWLLLILINVIVLIIVHMCVRKKAVLRFGLCARHKRRRTVFVLITWLLALGTFVFLLGGVAMADAYRNDDLAIAGVLLGVCSMIAALVTGFGFARLLTPVKIDHQFARFKGCGPDFLTNFPASR